MHGVGRRSRSGLQSRRLAKRVRDNSGRLLFLRRMGRAPCRATGLGSRGRRVSRPFADRDLPSHAHSHAHIIGCWLSSTAPSPPALQRRHRVGLGGWRRQSRMEMDLAGARAQRMALHLARRQRAAGCLRLGLAAYSLVVWWGRSRGACGAAQFEGWGTGVVELVWLGLRLGLGLRLRLQPRKEERVRTRQRPASARATCHCCSDCMRR